LAGTDEFGSLGPNEQIDSLQAAARVRIPMSGSKKLSRKKCLSRLFLYSALQNLVGVLPATSSFASRSYLIREAIVKAVVGVIICGLGGALLCGLFLFSLYKRACLPPCSR
jgi:hypothetical protein